MEQAAKRIRAACQSSPVNWRATGRSAAHLFSLHVVDNLHSTYCAAHGVPQKLGVEAPLTPTYSHTDLEMEAAILLTTLTHLTHALSISMVPRRSGGKI